MTIEDVEFAQAWSEGNEERREAEKKAEKEREELAQLRASGGTLTTQGDLVSGAALTPRARAYAERLKALKKERRRDGR